MPLLLPHAYRPVLLCLGARLHMLVCELSKPLHTKAR